jgi:hypothetical protein
MVCHPFRGEPWRAVAIGPPVTDYIAIGSCRAAHLWGFAAGQEILLSGHGIFRESTSKRTEL